MHNTRISHAYSTSYLSSYNLDASWTYIICMYIDILSLMQFASVTSSMIPQYTLSDLNVMGEIITAPRAMCGVAVAALQADLESPEGVRWHRTTSTDPRLAMEATCTVKMAATCSALWEVGVCELEAAASLIQQGDVPGGVGGGPLVRGGGRASLV